MAHQIVYTEIPQQQVYIQNPNLVQYNLDSNLQDQLGLGGVQYNVANLPAQITNNQPVYSNLNYSPNQIYQQYIQQPINQQYIYQQQIEQNVQQVYPQNNDNSKQYQNQIQMQVQPQIIQQNYYYHNDPRAQINPQQQVQNAQAQQKLQPQIAQQNYHHHKNQRAQISPQKQVQNVQAQKKIQPQLKQQVQTNNQQQNQQREYLSAEHNYMKYLQKFPNQNANQKINIEYNKKDEHFVNRPIYQKRKLTPNPDKNKAEPKKLKTLDDTPTLLHGTKVINKKSNTNKQKNQLAENPQKGVSPKLQPIIEEDANIAQSGFANK